MRKGKHIADKKASKKKDVAVADDVQAKEVEAVEDIDVVDAIDSIDAAPETPETNTENVVVSEQVEVVEGDKSIFVDAPRTSRKARVARVICSIIAVLFVFFLGVACGLYLYQIQPYYIPL